MVPRDKRKPAETSGIRVGTPAVTTRGRKEAEMGLIANCIADVLERGEAAVASVREKVIRLTDEFPLYE